MDFIFNVLLIIHVISGFTALIVGLIPMIAKKGGKLHNQSGLIYFWSMFGVFISSQPMALIKSNAFLFTIGTFSFYLALSGYRFSKRKGWEHLQSFDKIYMFITFITSLIMLGYAIYLTSTGILYTAIILGVFGTICFLFSSRDLKRFGKTSKPKHWIILHLVRMIGAYIATFTAFAVTNIHFLPGLVLWIMPTVIGITGSILAAKHFRKKYKIV